MAAGQTKALSFSETKKNLDTFFQEQLDNLGLSEDCLNQQIEEELHRSLTIIDQAIENHESFGKFGVTLTAEAAVIITAKTESLFEIGILPLLLERKQIILARLSEFDSKNSISEEYLQTRRLNIQRELEKLAKRETNRRLWAVIAALTGVWSALFLLIQRLGWDLLEPWTYLVGFALTIIGYAYLVIRGKEFSPFALYNQALELRKAELSEIFQIDDTKHTS